MKMDQQKFEERCAIKFCVKLGESATVTYEHILIFGWNTGEIFDKNIYLLSLLPTLKQFETGRIL